MLFWEIVTLRVQEGNIYVKKCVIVVTHFFAVQINRKNRFIPNDIFIILYLLALNDLSRLTAHETKENCSLQLKFSSNQSHILQPTLNPKQIT